MCCLLTICSGKRRHFGLTLDALIQSVVLVRLQLYPKYLPASLPVVNHIANTFVYLISSWWLQPYEWRKLMVFSISHNNGVNVE